MNSVIPFAIGFTCGLICLALIYADHGDRNDGGEETRCKSL